MHVNVLLEIINFYPLLNFENATSVLNFVMS